MEDNFFLKAPVLLAGNGSGLYSIAVCLLRAGHPVELCTENPHEASIQIAAYMADAERAGIPGKPDQGQLKIVRKAGRTRDRRLAIGITIEDMAVKKAMLRELEEIHPPGAAIVINSESVSLDRLQQEARFPERIIGMNWVIPAHTTCFLEIITNSAVREPLVPLLYDLAKISWLKDPYIVRNSGIRGRLISAMAREAFYLVENNYATVEDIDRACRNDAGYYLPFAGNCRYMDLMGTYAYGKVMEDLNPDLSRDQELPRFFTAILEKGGKGMQNRKGLYDYLPEEVDLWKEAFGKFSYQIREILDKYPFNYR